MSIVDHIYHIIVDLLHIRRKAYKYNSMSNNLGPIMMDFTQEIDVIWQIYPTSLLKSFWN